MSPVVRCLLAADRVARTIKAGRSDLFGVFHALNVALPFDLTFAAYYVLTGFDGPTAFDVTFTDPAGRVIGAGEYQVPDVRPADVVQGFGTVCVTLTSAGTYRLRVEWEGQVLAEQPIVIGTP